ncbi:MAG: antibiotic biosynthesis monooxygenase [Flavobacteriaceae bacterium]|nr:antibiotic biosynthesis monooxygenase [Flavobacteriaceae bacterium]
MFIRIVKMEFQPAKIDAFLQNFELVKEKIRYFPGCHHLELYRDKTNTNIFFTYSKWEEEAALEAYRNSALFKSVWSQTKPKFSKKAEAWSVDAIVSL